MIKIKLWSAPTSTKINMRVSNIIAQEMFRSKHEAISAMQELQRVINEELI